MILQPQIVGQNDYGYQLPFTLQDGNGNSVNLTGAILTITVQASPYQPGVALFTGAMTVDSAPAGTCHYTVAQGNFPSTGTFLAQVTATWSSSEVLTWSGITIIVQPKLPQ